MDNGGFNRLQALLEIAALQAVFGLETVALQSVEHQQLVDLSADGSLEEEAAAAQLGSQGIDLTIHCRANASSVAPTPTFPGSDLTRAQAGCDTVEVEAELGVRVRLPPSYLSCPYPPNSGISDEAVSESTAACCSVVHVSCCAGRRGAAAPGREWADGMGAQLTGIAQQAAGEGRPCLHELVEHMQTAASALAATQRQLLQQQQQEQGRPGPYGVEAADEVLLLRLDHMHDRGLYCRTVGGWVKDLRLTGRLIFQGGLILLLLEGNAPALKEYLVRHRTESVDVDSRGRKCKERMMTVIGQQQPQQMTASPARSASSAIATSTAAAAGGPEGRAFLDFREVTLASLDEVGQLLQRAGVGEWLRPAAGLPPN